MIRPVDSGYQPVKLIPHLMDAKLELALIMEMH
jgi:hypothetical protein